MSVDRAKDSPRSPSVHHPTSGLPTLAWVAGTDLMRWLPLLQRLREHFHVVVASHDAEQIQSMEEAGLSGFCHSMGRSLKPLRDLEGLWRLRRQLLTWQPDVAVFTGRKMGIIGPLAGRLARVPMVVRMISGLGTLHTYATPAVLRRRRFMEGALRIGRNLADVTLFQSPSDRRRYGRLGVIERRRSRVIHGIGSSLEPPQLIQADALHRLAVRQRLGLPEDCEMVVMLTRLTRSKGIEDLIRAMPILRSQRPDCHVVLAGRRNVEALDSISDRRLTELQRHVLWLGERSDEEDLLRAADLFLYPSFYREGVPRPLLRAAAYGLPIVAVECDASRQVIEHGETGWLVPKHRPRRLAAAVEKLLEDRALAACLAERARREIGERFSLQRASTEFAALVQAYLDALGARQPSVISGRSFETPG